MSSENNIIYNYVAVIIMVAINGISTHTFSRGMLWPTWGGRRDDVKSVGKVKEHSLNIPHGYFFIH